MIEIVKIAKQHADKYGWQVFPVNGKAPAAKGIDWRRLANKWEHPAWENATGYGVILLDMTVVDIDNIQEANKLHLPPTDTLAVKTRKGIHLYFLNGWTKGAKIKSGATHVIDIKTDGGYVVGPGSYFHDGSGQYEVIHDSMISALTNEWVDFIEKHTATRLVDEARALYTSETMAEGGRNDYLTSYAGYLRAGNASEDEVREALVIRNRNACTPPLGDSELEVIIQSSMSFAPNPSLVAMREYRERMKNAMPDMFVKVRDLINEPVPKPMITNLFPAGGLNVLYGAPGTYKSFIALDWATSLADNRPLASLLTSNSDRWQPLEAHDVLYVAAEGVGGMGKRALAMGLRDTNLTVYKTSVNLLDVEADGAVDLFLEQVIEQGFKVIFFDTLRKVMPGGDENKVQDVGPMLSMLGDWSTLHGITSVLIHHSNRADGGSYRGSSAIEGDCDNMWRVKKTSELAATISTHKFKDAEPIEVNVLLESCVVHPPHDEEPSTSLRVVGYANPDDPVRGDGTESVDPAEPLRTRIAELEADVAGYKLSNANQDDFTEFVYKVNASIDPTISKRERAGIICRTAAFVTGLDADEVPGYGFERVRKRMRAMGL